MFIQSRLESISGHMVVLSLVTGYDNFMHVEKKEEPGK